MKANKKIVGFTFCSLMFAFTTQAQDLHFSQFFNSPLTTNPANTGFIPGGDYRIGINYRNQWSSIMTVPYQTMSAFGDMQIMQSENGWLGAGGLIQTKTGVELLGLNQAIFPLAPPIPGRKV